MTEDERHYGEKLGERIAQARGGKTQVLFANELGVNKNTLLGYEKGRVVPDILTIKKICSLCHVNWDWLVNAEGPMHSDEGRVAGEIPPPQAGLAAPLADRQPAQDTFDSLGMAEGMGLLAQIYGSADNIYIRAINANLMAFADAVKTKARSILLEQTIQQMQAQMLKMQEQLNELKKEVLCLRNENSELKRELRADRKSVV